MAVNRNIFTYTPENRGRAALLFLLFLLAIYEFISAGFNAFAIVCLIPIFVLYVIATFRWKMFTFWLLMGVNYFVQWKNFPSVGLPTSALNELLEIVLIALAIIDVKEAKFERTANIMLVMLLSWAAFCTLEVFNDSCNLGIQVDAWYTGARMMAFQLLYAFFVYILYITTPKRLIKYLVVWGSLSIFGAFWVWKQKNIGFTDAENSWLQTVGYRTHIINGGTLIRYFSVFSDAASFGINMAATAVAFLIFGITNKIKKIKYFCLIAGAASFWATFPSGTRTSIFCFFAGIMLYIVLSKSVKIATSVSIAFVLFVFMLAFTDIGNGNQQIRRMRSAFNEDDASANVRDINKAEIKKYLVDAPWGIGVGIGYDNVPANNKYRRLSTIPPDSEYVFIWVHTGIIGITFFLITTAIMLITACWTVFFKIKSPTLRGIGSGFCCAFIAIQLGGYANQVLMQFPNCLLFYGGLSLVFALPHFEDEWNEYEKEQLAIQAEKERIKLEKKRAKRV